MATAEHTRLAYLEAMGIQAWRLRVAPPLAAAASLEHEDASPGSAGVSPASAAGETPALPAEAALAEPAGLSSAAPGVPPPSPAADPHPSRNALPPVDRAFDPSEDTLFAEPPRKTAASCTWDELQARVKACTACPLHQTRTQTVFGVGDKSAGWMVIGEAPGEQEDLQGEPFVGRAGLLLNEMLRAIGLAREEVFIANILKCRPPKNRDPQPDEAAACEGHLRQQLALVKPKIILAVGRIAAQNLLKTTTPVGKLRGRVHDYQGVPLVVVYHPAYLLRSPLEKRAAFDDLRLALHTYRQTL